MKKATINLYTARELSEKAQERAHSDWEALGMYAWGEDNRKTLNTFCELFPVTCPDWGYGDGRPFARASFSGTSEQAEFSGLRLHKHLMYNYFDALFKGKYYSMTRKRKRKGEHYSYVQRYSAVIFEERCPTGYCLDYDIMQPIRDFLKKPDDTTFEQLMENCLTAWAKACERDHENYYSIENFLEESDANDYTYLANGKHFVADTA